MERRRFLKVLGVSGSAALLDQCAAAPPQTLIPYFVPPDGAPPGVATHYATTCRQCPAGCGMVVKTVNGRVTKAEGSPQHPIGRGRLCARGQAAVQAIYNPDRFRQPLVRDEFGAMQPISWPDAETLLANRLRAAKFRGANRVAWIGELLTGSLDRLTAAWLRALDSDRRFYYETFDYEPLRRAGALAFGRAEVPRYHFDRAAFVLSFGAEFLETWISNVEFTAAFAEARRRRARDPFGAFACVAPRLSLTGLNADAWAAARPGSEVLVALAIAHAIVDGNLAHPSAAGHLGWLRLALAPYAADRTGASTEVKPETIQALARQFTSAAPSLAVGGGASGSASRWAVELELAVLLLNALAGNIGTTVAYGADYALNRLATRDDLSACADQMQRGDVRVLLIHKANPVLTLPAAHRFADALSNVPFIVSFASGPDETTDRAHLILPDDHALESWGDYTPRAGVAGVQQPAAERLFDTRATGDVLIEVANQIDEETARACGSAPWRDYVRSTWNAPAAASGDAGSDADLQWAEILRAGGRFAENDDAVSVDLRDVTPALKGIAVAERASSDSFTLVACPSAHFYDGRHANEPWLQEVPDPATKTVWNGYVEIHPDAAARLGIAEGDGVRVRSAHGRAECAAHLTRATRADTIAMPIGYGRSRSLHTAGRRGGNPVALLPAQAADGPYAAWQVDGVVVERVRGGRLLPMLDTATGTREGRQLAMIVRPDRVDAPHPPKHPPVDFYPPHQHPQHRWGMAIDLNACTGCNACVVACYAENNIAVVGEQFCAQGREMSWLRIEREQHAVAPDRGLARPANVFMPMLCQHCDQAPCESVCPVDATYHNPEGLNAQVYVRCIGTRFCSNNCPYKVRRFNWARYGWPAPLGEQLNPDVTVRSVGVMEKCTFCVQRIQAGKLAATRDGREVRDGDIVSACAQTCPADAIVFGDLRDPTSRVSRLSTATHGYHALEELNTRPAITYLRRSVPGAREDGD